MLRPMDMKKPSDALGVSFKLGDLLKTVQRAMLEYGENTMIYAYNRNPGMALHVHFPNGHKPHITFTHIENDASIPEPSGDAN
jgi:hypothetical protein